MAEGPRRPIESRRECIGSSAKQVVAWGWALPLWARRDNYIKDLPHYAAEEASPSAARGREAPGLV